jgi:hypothetical protein
MAEDLYSKWLGLPPGRRPPDHYALLGLPRFCKDRQAIDAAASTQLGKLDAYSIHPDREKRDACHRMMNEVASARVTLIDDRRRGEYDGQLRSNPASQMDSTLEMPAAGAPGSVLDSTMEMPAGGAMDGTLEMPAAQGHDAASQPSPDSHRLLRDMAGAAETPAEEDDPIARTMAEIQGKPVLDEALPEAKVGSDARIPWMLIGGGVMFLIAGAVAIGLLIGGGSAKPKPPEPTPAPVAGPEPASRGGAVFFDNFERSEPGVEYRLVTGAPDSLRIQEGKLTFQSPSIGAIRVDLIPQKGKAFDEVSARISIEPGCRVVFGIINAARMTLSREGNFIDIVVQPGYPGTDPNTKRDWPRIEVPAGDGGSVPVRLFRRRDHVIWAIGDNQVATSPEFRVMGDPGITIETSGGAGQHATVDDLKIWFAR